MERKLASIKRITNITPIEGADKIERVSVGGWNVVSQKGIHKVGDLVVYFEIDSFLPIDEKFEFLRKSSYKKLNDGREGFVLRTIKLRGVISQGLIIPMRELFNESTVDGLAEGDDASELLGITKYEPPIPAELAGEVVGAFPTSLFSKTDEERIQNLSNEYEDLKKEKYYVTEKLDGTSCTYFFDGKDLRVCGRNYEYKRSETNSLWKFAINNDLETKLKDLYNKSGLKLCIQGELIGNGINGNIYKLSNHDFRAFNVIDIDSKEYVSAMSLVTICTDLNIKTVPILEMSYSLPHTIDDLLLFAEGKSAINEKTEREGVVIRNNNKSKSFKVISNKFLLNEKS